jgi:hypothetical protein
MAAFDFLNTTGADIESNSAWANPDTGFEFGGTGDGIAKLLQDPNMLQALGNMGESISKGEPIGTALNPANLIRQIQTQKAGSELLKQILSGNNSKLGSGSSKTSTPTPTPIGAPGPDTVTTKKTADGTTTIIQEPTAENLSTYGTSVPLEATPAMATGGGSGSSPFWQALFNQ